MLKKEFSQLTPSERYIVLALAADRLLPDRPIVFHFYGPPCLTQHANSWVKRGIESVILALYEVESDANELSDAPPLFRRTYLSSLVRSLRSLIEAGDFKPTGKLLSDAVFNILGFVPPAPFDVGRIDFEASSPMPPLTDKDIRGLIDGMFTCFRQDILPHIFYGDEFMTFLKSSKVGIARSKPDHPPCYYRYHGLGRGSFALSAEHRKNTVSAVRTVMHELCPGHHIYYLYREMLFRWGLLGEETTLDLVYSAETPVAEGIAEAAPYFIRSMPPELMQRVRSANEAEHLCKKALYNVWYHRYIDMSMDEQGAVEYLKRAGNFEPHQIATWLKFIDDWRIYYPSYPAGTEAVQRHMNLEYFYLPRTLQTLQKPRRSTYEEEGRRQTVLPGPHMTASQPQTARRQIFGGQEVI
jgi:hypothetical protein